jgi:hypothetical protein
MVGFLSQICSLSAPGPTGPLTADNSPTGQAISPRFGWADRMPPASRVSPPPHFRPRIDGHRLLCSPLMGSRPRAETPPLAQPQSALKRMQQTVSTPTTSASTPSSRPAALPKAAPPPSNQAKLLASGLAAAAAKDRAQLKAMKARRLDAVKPLRACAARPPSPASAPRRCSCAWAYRVVSAAAFRRRPTSTPRASSSTSARARPSPTNPTATPHAGGPTGFSDFVVSRGVTPSRWRTQPRADSSRRSPPPQTRHSCPSPPSPSPPRPSPRPSPGASRQPIHRYGCTNRRAPWCTGLTATAGRLRARSWLRRGRREEAREGQGHARWHCQAP